MPRPAAVYNVYKASSSSAKLQLPVPPAWGEVDPAAAPRNNLAGSSAVVFRNLFFDPPSAGQRILVFRSRHHGSLIAQLACQWDPGRAGHGPHERQSGWELTLPESGELFQFPGSDALGSSVGTVLRIADWVSSCKAAKCFAWG